MTATIIVIIKQRNAIFCWLDVLVNSVVTLNLGIQTLNMEECGTDTYVSTIADPVTRVITLCNYKNMRR